MKPLVSKIKEAGCSYRWGFQLHAIVTKENWTFIRNKQDAESLLSKLDVRQFEVTDWLLDL